MELKVKHISHKLIDTLSDGVFSIALTLLGLDVVGLVHGISESEDFNSAMFEHWPTFLAYVIGFFVLFSWWYQYHVTGQYVVGTNATIVWNHGFAMAWVALMPFGVALLAENLNTPNMKWGVFYFGICLFGYAWTTCIQFILAKLFKGDTNFNFSEDFILSSFTQAQRFKFLGIFQAIPATIGIILVSICLINPWFALAGYVVHILTQVNPVKSMNSMAPMLMKMAKLPVP
jgi:uncharacterized membrane protein